MISNERSGERGLDEVTPLNLTRFDRTFFDREHRLKYIGAGGIGGKAHGLSEAESILSSRFSHAEFPGIEVSVPSLTVLRTSLFDSFLDRNEFDPELFAGATDEAIARIFQRGNFPAEALGDLRALVEQVRTPLAVRSSSLLEDAMAEPFAGVYVTKMIPNHQSSADDRFRKLIEAIKLIYASTFFQGARDYLASTRRPNTREKMAVIIQEVVGRRYRDRFYPSLSGVARSWNYFAAGAARPEDGVVSLALGLGKTIVDGGVCWTYSPARPASPSFFGSTTDLIANTQSRFWAINMGPVEAWDPVHETEYLVQPSLTDSERDGSLAPLASTFDAHSGRISPGIGRQGPRVLNFAPLLVHREIPINDVVTRLLRLSEDTLGCPVEVEFAMSIDPHRFGFLQVRPMTVSGDQIVVENDEMADPRVVVRSRRTLGNGTIEGIRDVVYVRPDRFDARWTKQIAMEIGKLNAELVRSNTPYLLVGFGRWGSADSWLGIPVEWPQISGARVIVEAMTEGMNVELSQGSHFFHNLTSFNVPYFSVPLHGDAAIDWTWLENQELRADTGFARHVKAAFPLTVRVDGRAGRGVIRHHVEPSDSRVDDD